MPQPTLSDVHVDRALTDLSVRFSQSNNRFISDQVFPRINVANRSDKYFTYDRSFWFRSDAQLRGPATEAAGTGYEIGTDSFSCDVYAVRRMVDDQTRANADSPVTLDRDAAEFVTMQIMQRREIDWVNTFFTTSVWTTDVVGSTDFAQWSDFAASDPIRDMRDGITSMLKLTSYKPNTLVLGHEVWDKIQDHPDYLARIQGGATTGTPAMFQTNLLASMLGVDRVLVSDTIKNTAAEGETASYDFHFGKNALLLYVPSSPGLNTPASGYTFQWSGFIGTGSNGIRIKRYRQENIASDIVEAEEARDLKLVSADLGYFFSACVA